MTYDELKDFYTSLMSDDVKVISYKHHSSRILHFLSNQKAFRQLFLNLGYTQDELKEFTLYSIPHKYNIFDMLFNLNMELRSERAKLIGGKKLLCAHIRHAKTGEKVKAVHVQARKEINEIWKSLKNLFNRDQYKHHLLYVAADSENVTQQASNIFKNRFIKANSSLTNIQRWSKGGKTPEASDACNGLRRVILDWKVLSECSLIIKSPLYSTFSGSAISMSRNKVSFYYHERLKELHRVGKRFQLLKNINTHPLINCTFTEKDQGRCLL
ncbi:DgyrCDS14765 [Dimorphilus gyrociliatus]|uniref:DgyrCDS14765 n=1 Tax=Dimorphilus gyrociliatus TaxID=2664684 RepID=A0A7I8WER4_9ANNE|nr:DgyrCDS14765 [Dimorphilus gyrociliatus]